MCRKRVNKKLIGISVDEKIQVILETSQNFDRFNAANV